MGLAVQPMRCMQESGIETANDEVGEISGKFIPGHVEGTIVSRCMLMVVILFPEFWGPFFGTARPISLPYCFSPGVSHLHYSFAVYFQKF